MITPNAAAPHSPWQNPASIFDNIRLEFSEIPPHAQPIRHDDSLGTGERDAVDCPGCGSGTTEPREPVEGADSAAWAEHLYYMVLDQVRPAIERYGTGRNSPEVERAVESYLQFTNALTSADGRTGVGLFDVIGDARANRQMAAFAAAVGMFTCNKGAKCSQNALPRCPRSVNCEPKPDCRCLLLPTVMRGKGGNWKFWMCYCVDKDAVIAAAILLLALLWWWSPAGAAAALRWVLRNARRVPAYAP